MNTKALFHLAVRTLGNKKGSVKIKFSPLRAIAYRTGMKLQDPFHQDIADFSHKQDIQPLYSSSIDEYNQIRSPQDAHVKLGAEYNDEGLSRSFIAAPSYISNPLLNNLNTEAIWLAAGKKETKQNANFAREIILNIPKDLDEKERSDLLVKICAHIAETHGVVVEGVLHTSKDNMNPHAHIMFSTRRMVNTHNNSCNESMFSIKTDELDRWPSPQFLERIDLPQQKYESIQQELKRFDNRLDLLPEEIQEKAMLQLELHNFKHIASLSNHWRQRKESNDPQSAPVPLLRKQIRKLVDQSLAAKGIKTQEDSGITYFINWLTYLTQNELNQFQNRTIEDLLQHYCQNNNQIDHFESMKATFTKLHHKFFLKNEVNEENISILKNALKNTQSSRESAKKITYISGELRNLLENFHNKIDQINFFYASEVTLSAKQPLELLKQNYTLKIENYSTAIKNLLFFCKTKYYQINKKLGEINKTLPENNSLQVLSSDLFKKSTPSAPTPDSQSQGSGHSTEQSDELFNFFIEHSPAESPADDQNDFSLFNMFKEVLKPSSLIHFIPDQDTPPSSPVNPVSVNPQQPQNPLATTAIQLLQFFNIQFKPYTHPENLKNLKESINHFTASLDKTEKKIQRLIKTLQLNQPENIQEVLGAASYKRTRSEILNNQEQPERQQQDEAPRNKLQKKQQ